MKSDGRERGFTWRALALGAGLLFLWIYFFTARYVIVQAVMLHQIMLLTGLGAVFTLFLVKAASELLLPAETRLARGELVVLFAILLVGIPASAMMRGYLEAVMTINLPAYNRNEIPVEAGGGERTTTAEAAPGWWTIRQPPPGKPAAEWTPAEREAVAAFNDFRRGNEGDVPWRLWAGPIVYWGGMLLLFQALLIGALWFMSRRWVEEEKLNFPLARLPLAFLGTPEEDEEDRASPAPRPGPFRNWRLWLAFGLGLLFCLPRVLFLDVANPVPVPPDAQTFHLPLSGLTIVQGWAIRLNFDPLLLLLLLFFSVDVLLTAVVVYLALRVGLVYVLGLFGVPAHHLGEVLLQHGAMEGGLIGLVFWSGWFHRDHLWAAVKSLWGFSRSLGRAWRAWLYLALLVGFVLLAFPVRPFPLVLAVVTVGLILVYNLGFARFRAEAGFDTLDPYSPGRLHGWLEAHQLGVFDRAAGSYGLWGTQAGWMAQGHVWALAGYFRGLGAQLLALDLFSLGARTRTRGRDVLAGIAAGLVLGLVLVTPLYLTNAYTYGQERNDVDRGHANYLNWTYNAHRFGTTEPKVPGEAVENSTGTYLLFLPLGFALCGLLMYCRREWVSFPFSPAGLVLAGCLGNASRSLLDLDQIWFPLLLVVGLKLVWFRWFGVRAFQRRLLPLGLFLAMGLVLGIFLYLLRFAVSFQQGVMIGQ